MKKILPILLLTPFLLSLSACGKGKEEKCKALNQKNKLSQTEQEYLAAECKSYSLKNLNDKYKNGQSWQ